MKLNESGAAGIEVVRIFGPLQCAVALDHN